METALWTTQLLLAAIFFATGLTKLTQPRAQLAAGPMGWAAELTDVEFRTVGLLEVLGALETDRLAVPIVLLALTLFLAIERFGAHSLG